MIKSEHFSSCDCFDVPCANCLKVLDTVNSIVKVHSEEQCCSPSTYKTSIEKEANGVDIEVEKIELKSLAGKSEFLDVHEQKPTFCKEKHIRTVSKHVRWIPPRSPYNLIQESLYYKPWQLLVATIFLNKTSARVAVPLFWKFVNKWSTPENLQDATIVEIAALMKPLGLNVRRAIQIKHFTHDFLHKDWRYPKELAGIGQYGDDSYRIFCVNEWKEVNPQDSKLKKYIAWLMENYGN